MVTRTIRSMQKRTRFELCPIAEMTSTPVDTRCVRHRARIRDAGTPTYADKSMFAMGEPVLSVAAAINAATMLAAALIATGMR